MLALRAATPVYEHCSMYWPDILPGLGQLWLSYGEQTSTTLSPAGCTLLGKCGCVARRCDGSRHVATRLCVACTVVVHRLWTVWLPLQPCVLCRVDRLRVGCWHCPGEQRASVWPVRPPGYRRSLSASRIWADAGSGFSLHVTRASTWTTMHQLNRAIKPYLGSQASMVHT